PRRPKRAWPLETTAINSRPDVRDQRGQSPSSQSVAGIDRSQYTSPCGHRCQRRYVRRYKRYVALPWDVPFKRLLLRVLERIFSFFPSPSANPRALIQHSDFAQFLGVCSSAKPCEIGENLLSVFDLISGSQERLIPHG